MQGCLDQVPRRSTRNARSLRRTHVPSPPHNTTAMTRSPRSPRSGVTDVQSAAGPSQPRHVLPTPAATQATTEHTRTESTVSARQRGQQIRRARERAQRATAAVPPASELPTPPATQAPHQLTRRQIGQRERRARERAAREVQLPPPSPAPSIGSARPAAPPPLDGFQHVEQLSNRQIGQRARRARKLAEREGHLPDSDQSVAPRSVVHRMDPPLPLARQAYHEPARRHDSGSMNIACTDCRALHWTAERVRHNGGWGFGMCCDHGMVQLDPLPEPPDELRQLLDGSDPDSKEFRDNIRQYNAALAFTSLGVEVDESVNRRGPGPYIFRIHGELCHRVGSLLPSAGHRPSYAQLYIHDPQEALAHRMARNPNLLRQTMEKLQRVLARVHRYADIYKHAYEVLAAHPDAPSVSLTIMVDSDHDRRRYNMPTSDEVAVILPGDGTHGGSSGRDIILHRRDGPLRRLYDTNPAYPSLHYVLILPFGTHGWSWDMRMHEPEKANPRRLTQSRYYAYHLFERSQEFSTVLQSGRLFQQYLVDSWAMTEQNRLKFLQENQATLRAALYSGLLDHVRASDEVDLNQLGQRVILPSSFTGSPRYMQQLFQDSLAIGRYCRSIDLFITVTANPKWPEIVRELKDGERAEDRPDITTRVFQLKKKAILDDILKNGVFGRTVAHVYTIEFQKRGLPHMHLLVFLDPRDKIRTPEDVDSCIRAYWPDPDEEPLLFSTVQRCMVHGPCGELNPHAPCMENGRCTKGFPRPFRQDTQMNAEGYPEYRTPDDGRKYKVGNH
jgi:hypothetical protein